MKEVPYLPIQGEQFYVEYATASVIFHPDRLNTTMAVTYLALGSVIRASDLNVIVRKYTELALRVDELEKKLLAQDS